MNETNLSHLRMSAVRECSWQWRSPDADTHNASQRGTTAIGTCDKVGPHTANLHSMHWHGGVIASAVLSRTSRRCDGAGDTSSRPEAASFEQ